MKSRNDKAFTLIELLVVVAIMTILMALLLPSLSHAREEAKAVTCGSQERQLGLLMLAFHEDHGYLPFSSWSGTRFSWVDMMLGSDETQYTTKTTRYCPDSWNTINYFGGNIKIIRCPKADTFTNIIDQMAGYVAIGNGFANPYLKLDGPESNQMRNLMYAKLKTWQRQSGNAMLACSKTFCFSDHFAAYYDETPSSKVSGRHVGTTTNFLYQDGHVERRRPATDSLDRLDSTRQTMVKIGYGSWQ